MPVRAVRNIVKKVFIVLTCILSGVFLISCLVPYLNPSSWWFMGFLGLGIPYMVVLLIFCIFFWWVIRARYSLIPIITLLIGWKQLSVLFAVNRNATFVDRKQDGHLRIVNWNVRSFQGLSEKADKKRIDRLSIADAITRQNPDIICLQEFNHSAIQNNLALFGAKYPYHYFSRDFQRGTTAYYSGSVIFSKYPIVDTARVQYPGRLGESLIYTDIKVPERVIRVFTTHLQSFKFNREDYEGMEQIKKNEDEGLNASKSLFQKMKLAFTKRGERARIVRDVLDRSPHPSIICGDFNDVPNSYTYFHIRKNFQDAFLAKSIGIGRTYLDVAPTLRIDYILADKQFNVVQFDMVDENLSDHLMLVTDVTVK